MSDPGYIQAKEQIAHLEAELAEFQASSRELERELETELEESETKHKTLQRKIDELTAQVEEWKQKHLDLSKEYASNQQSLQKQIASLQRAHQLASDRLREIEMTNDDMERHERITKTSLQELEQKYHKSLEDIAMLESEVANKEDIQVELQRTKDELRDTREELSVASNKIDQLEKEAEEMQDKVSTESSPTANVIRTHRFRITSDPSAAMSAITVNASSPTSTGTTPPVALPRMTSSKSLRKIHGMLDQMKHLESRVAYFKSSLPKPVTPTKSNSTGSPRSASSQGMYRSASSDKSPSNLPVPSPSSRRTSSVAFIDRALTEKRPPNTSRQSSLLDELPMLHNTSRQGKMKPQHRPTVSSSVEWNEKQPKRMESNGSLNGSEKSDPRDVKRPGSAFSALHGRSGLGHGRFVQ